MSLLKKISNWDFKIPYLKKKIIRLKFQAIREYINIKPNIKKDFKVFCIGYQKTGTTSVEQALKQMGFKVAIPEIGYMLVEDIYNKKYDNFINYCETADAFQDTPFFMNDLYKILDYTFPNSKFILTIRDNEDIWFQSMYRFFLKNNINKIDKILPEDIKKNDTFLYKNYLLNHFKMLYPNSDLFDEENYKMSYKNHIKEVIEYFKDRDNLLVLNLKAKNSYQNLGQFLGVEVDSNEIFPWENNNS